MTTTPTYLETYQHIKRTLGKGSGVLRYMENGTEHTFDTGSDSVLDGVESPDIAGAWDIYYKMLGVANAPWVLLCSHTDIVTFTQAHR